MRFGSVCSGIEAASVAWEPLGWEPVFFSEIDRFPSAVLEHRFPHVPNLGDMTRFQEWPDASLDLLVGGTPCQSFSVAGLRRGMEDPRGNLALVYLGLVERYRPRWVVWENVPGVLSSSGGRDFGSFVGGLGKLGYGWAYRVLDAQYFGVAQRRRRVFVVGHLGDWRRAAEVLFEAASLRGDPAPRREAGEGVAPTLASRTRGGGGLGTDAECDGAVIPIQEIGKRQSGDPTNGVGYGDPGDPMYTLQAGAQHGVALCLNAHGQRLDGESETFVPVAHQLTARHDSSEDGCGRGVPLVPAIAFHNRQDPDVSGEVTHPLGAQDNWMAVQTRAAVRRLTPRECERLQGFPDDWTLIPYHGKKRKPAKDGPRYKALGNSMAVPVMRWIGERIARSEAVRLVREVA